jgi:beta-phosphoglucomutase
MSDAVVFDFDGVIADTERLHLAAFQEVFAGRGWTLDEAAYFERYLGYDDHGLVAAYAHDAQLSLDGATMAALVRAKVSAVSRHRSSPEVPYSAAGASIAALAREFRLAIASGALHAEIDAILRAGGLRDAFTVLVGADDVAASKPAPDSYLAAARGLGVSPDACVAVEDSAAGVQAARTAGMRVIAITTTSPRQMLADADEIIASLTELTPARIRQI